MASDLADQTPDTLDLEAIKERSDRYLSMGDRLDAAGRLPNLDSRSTAHAIAIAASLTAPDVPDLLAELATLRQSLTEAEASHQAEMGRLQAELDQARADLVTESRRIRDAAAYERDDAVRARAAAVGTAQIWEHSATRAHARIADLEHAITQYLDSHGTAGTGVLGKRLKAAVGRVE